MSRRQFCLGLAAACVSPLLLAQPRRKRIFIITYRGSSDVEKGFRQYFAERGHAVEFIERDLGRDPKRVPGLLAEIRSLKPDLVFTWGTTVTEAFVGQFDAVDSARHLTDIPVVFALVAAPVASRLTPTLASSGRNLTGVYHVASTLAQVRAIQAYRPFKRLGVLYTASESNSRVVLEELRQLGVGMGFAIEARAFHRDAAGKSVVGGVPELLAEIRQAGAEWLYLPPDSFLGTQAQQLVIPAAHALGLPTFASTEQIMAAGALAGLVCRYFTIGQFAGHKAAQILFESLAPARIPIETLSRYAFLVRMPVARQLKWLPPLALFNQAEFVEAGAAEI